MINDKLLAIYCSLCNMCVPRVSQVLILSKTFINKTRILSVAEMPSGKAEVHCSPVTLPSALGSHLDTHHSSGTQK